MSRKALRFALRGILRALRTSRGLAALFQLALAFQVGPINALIEAWEHAHLNGVRHGHLIHFEARGSQDHDDACLAWLPSGSKAPVARGGIVVVASTTVRTRVVSIGPRSFPSFVHQPPSRAPPPQV